VARRGIHPPCRWRDGIGIDPTGGPAAPESPDARDREG